MDSSVNIEPEQDKPHDLSMKPSANIINNVTTNHGSENYHDPVISQKNFTEKNINSNSQASGGATSTHQNNQQSRKVKKYHIPPPLDLNAHTLEPDHGAQGGVLGGGHGPHAPHDPSVRVPKSPNELPRESLPLRKR